MHDAVNIEDHVPKGHEKSHKGETVRQQTAYDHDGHYRAQEQKNTVLDKLAETKFRRLRSRLNPGQLPIVGGEVGK